MRRWLILGVCAALPRSNPNFSKAEIRTEIRINHVHMRQEYTNSYIAQRDELHNSYFAQNFTKNVNAEKVSDFKDVRVQNWQSDLIWVVSSQFLSEQVVVDRQWQFWSSGVISYAMIPRHRPTSARSSHRRIYSLWQILVDSTDWANSTHMAAHWTEWTSSD
jgi:hypothetical protein